MLLYLDGETLMGYVSLMFAHAWQILNTTLFILDGKNVSLWTICVAFVVIKIFRDFLDIIGIWGYSEDDDDEELTWEDR